MSKMIQEEQDPDELTMAYLSGVHDGKKQRTWTGLTDDEVNGLWEMAQGWNPQKHFYLLVEAKLKEKNA